MDYMYGQLYKQIKEVEYKGRNSETAVVTVDQKTKTIRVDVKILSPEQLPKDAGNYVLLVEIDENGNHTLKWVSIQSTLDRIKELEDKTYKLTYNKDTDTSAFDSNITINKDLNVEGNATFNNNVTILKPPVDATDATNKRYVDDSIQTHFTNLNIENSIGDYSLRQKYKDSNIDYGAVASGLNAAAFGGKRYDKLSDTSRTPTSAVGNQSFAAGGSTHAYGDFSIALGKDTDSYQKASFAMGGGSIAGATKDEWSKYYWDFTEQKTINGGKGKDSSGNILDAKGLTYEQTYAFATAFGDTNKAKASDSFASGSYNVIEFGADEGFAEGSGNTIKSGHQVHVEGYGNTVSGLTTHVGGLYNTVNADESFVYGVKNNVSSVGLDTVLGHDNTVSGRESSIIGFSNKSLESDQFILGHDNTVSKQDQIVIGNRFVNDDTSSNIVIFSKSANSEKSSILSFGDEIITANTLMLKATRRIKEMSQPYETTDVLRLKEVIDPADIKAGIPDTDNGPIPVYMAKGYGDKQGQYKNLTEKFAEEDKKWTDFNLKNGSAKGSLVQSNLIDADGDEWPESNAYGFADIALGSSNNAYQYFAYTHGRGNEVGLTEEEFNDYFWDSENNVPLHGGQGKDSQGRILNDQGEWYSVSRSYSTAIGYQTKAKGRLSTTLGYQSKATEDSSIAGGWRTTASAKRAVALGINTVASGENSLSAGNETQAESANAISFGYRTFASGTESLAVGSGTQAIGNESIAAGTGSIANGTNAFANGYRSEANGDSAFANGLITKANGNNSTSLGAQNISNGENSFTSGKENTTTGINTTAIGWKNIAIGQGSMTAGHENKTNGTSSVALGVGNITSNFGEVVVGTYAESGTANQMFAVGAGSSASSRKTVFKINKSGDTKLAGGLEAADYFSLYKNTGLWTGGLIKSAIADAYVGLYGYENGGAVVWGNTNGYKTTQLRVATRTDNRTIYLPDKSGTVALISDLEDGLSNKLDTKGGVITGNLVISNANLEISKTTEGKGNLTVGGNLTVNGTTTTVDIETLAVKDNLIVANADNTTLINLSGLAIKTGKVNTKDNAIAYGILYDPTSSVDSVKLGLGEVDKTTNEFTFNSAEDANPVATRDDSSHLTNNHLLVWNSAKHTLIDANSLVDSITPASLGLDNFVLDGGEIVA